MSDQNKPKDQPQALHNPGPVPPVNAATPGVTPTNLSPTPHPLAASYNMGVTLDQTKVKSFLDGFAALAPFISMIPKVGPVIANVIPYVDSDAAAKAIVTIAGLPDHIKVQATTAAIEAVTQTATAHALKAQQP